MRLKLQELQEADSEAQGLRQQIIDGYEKIDEIFHHKVLPFVPKPIWMGLISRHYINPLAGHFGIKKTYELFGQQYYWQILRDDLKA